MEHYELRQRQSLPLEQKVILSQQRIREWLNTHDAYVSFSGGNDSVVTLDLCRQIDPLLPAVFCNTGVEFPDTVQFVKGFADVEEVRPRLPFHRVVQQYGWPVVSKEQAQFVFEIRTGRSAKLRDIRLNGNKWGRGKVSEKWKFLIDAPFNISHKCCHILKKEPLHRYEKRTGRTPFVGTRADESPLRVQEYLRYGCNAFSHKHQRSAPIAFWTGEDVRAYMDMRNLPSNPIYSKGWQRTGCAYCLFGAHHDKSPNRIQRLADTHPKMYRYAMKHLRLWEVMAYMHLPFLPETPSLEWEA